VGHTLNDSSLKLNLHAEFTHSFSHTDLLKNLVDVGFDNARGGFRVEVDTPHRGHYGKVSSRLDYGLSGIGG
jgi:hypothetical protein